MANNCHRICRPYRLYTQSQESNNQILAENTKNIRKDQESRKQDCSSGIDYDFNLKYDKNLKI